MAVILTKAYVNYCVVMVMTVFYNVSMYGDDLLSVLYICSVSYDGRAADNDNPWVPACDIDNLKLDISGVTCG